MNDKQVAAILKTNELILNKLIAVQAECRALREMNIVMLTGLAKFPEGQTPQKFADDLVQKAKTELENQTKQNLQEIEKILA